MTSFFSEIVVIYGDGVASMNAATSRFIGCYVRCEFDVYVYVRIIILVTDRIILVNKYLFDQLFSAVSEKY